jgi:NADP-dependent 3-hydroxy acid dehydrogenase YdfG
MLKRTAIITGASSGIGKATALRLAEKGVRMVLNARNKEKLAQTEKEINEHAAEIICHSVHGDISDREVTDNCIALCRRLWNECPSIFVASAGRGLPGTVIDSDMEEWDNLIDTNIKGLMYQLRSIGKAMLERGSNGSDFVSEPMDIVIIGSNIGRNVSPFNSVYGATKFATHGLTSRAL